MNNEVLKQKLAEANTRIKQLEELVYVDADTLLPNYRALEARSDAIRKYEHNGTFQVLYFDIDGLKHINDTYGHLVADDCIRESSHAVKSILGNDIGLFRPYATGDEFVVIIQTRLRDLVDQLTASRLIAERIRQTVASKLWTEQNVQLTASVGLTTGMFHEDLRGMLDRAEAMMRVSKQNGRDQVTACNLFEQLDALRVRSVLG